MNISDSIPLATTGNVNKQEDLTIKKGMKAYRDEYLTGLTEDELAEIKKKMKEYLEQNPAENDTDHEGYENYIKALLKQYGYKGNIDDYAVGLAAVVDKEIKEEQNQSVQKESPDVNALFDRATLGSMSVRNKLFE